MRKRGCSEADGGLLDAHFFRASVWSTKRAKNRNCTMRKVPIVKAFVSSQRAVSSWATADYLSTTGWILGCCPGISSGGGDVPRLGVETARLARETAE